MLQIQIKFFFLKSITDEDGYKQNTLPPGAYEIESLKNQIKRIIIEEEHYTKQIIPLQSNQFCRHLDLL